MDTKTRRTIRRLMEPDNRRDKFAVCVKINEKIVGHLMKGTSGKFVKTIFYLLCSDAYSSASAKVTDKRCNLWDGEGMQLLCKLNLSGQPLFVSPLLKELIKMKNLSSDIYLVFSFPFSRVESLSYPKELP